MASLFLLAASAAEGPVRRSVSVKGYEFSRGRLIELARQAIRGSPSSFLQVTFFGEGGGPPLPKPSHFDFEHWREVFEAAARTRMQVAEVISFRGNAVLRIREGDGAVEREVLSGRDPLQFLIHDRQFEIVHFGFSGPSRLGLQESVFIFVRSHSALNPADGIDLFNVLEPLFPGLAVAVEIRNDAWFVYQERYPFLNPFNEDRVAPSQRDYAGSPTMKCTGGAEGAHCELANL